MERFFKRKTSESSSKTLEYVDVHTLPSDPADRKPILSYNPNQRDEIRREYLLRGPCQPRDIVFPYTQIGVEMRRFSEIIESRFRGHDESDDSLNKGLFLEILELVGEISEEVAKVILGNAPGNAQMTSPKIQQDIKHCFAQEVLKQVFEDLGDDFFSLLIDESSDISKKEQMSVVIRYVNKYGVVKERFIGLVHVLETSALTLKLGIDELFCRYGLSLAKIRGQGNDGASNMSVSLMD
ncbi:hypothetical protein QVD17_24535 [Tagetes erecta]|uniref:DUF4371 domain-containing protein n=1 Tax=Tagetes erecta TaxID=13708 RepID=A0AAD8KFJ6_TARER|nr:hypothetical protein QVD17_24535 [Tagetes erecta]